ncbi:unnamed protein product [Euphydryas editha]|uniref:Reverse transcriptase n=1 Tax=Euphydryas editha TaxID=104508 RepID=A0AAU9ULG2_EUPED|nr:unnamed protein product [Euphydryas editha]
MVQNIEVLNLNFSSDHRPVRATLTLLDAKKNRSGFKNTQNATLKSEDELARYKECISAHLPDLLDSQGNISVQTHYDKIISAIKESLQSARTSNKNTRHKILSDRTLALLKRRQLLQKTTNKTRSMKNELSALYKLVGKRIKSDYTNYRSKILEKNLAQSGSSKKAYNELRTNKTWIDGLEIKGKTLNNRNDIIAIATDFYKKLYNVQGHENIDDSINFQSDELPISCMPFSETEVIQAINRLKANKSPGSDNITNESIKSAHLLLTLPLTQLFNRILENANTPT